MAEKEKKFDVQTLVTWVGPGRPYRKKRQEYYIFVFILFVLFEIILLLFHQYELMLVVFALAFLTVVLASIPPGDFHYKITNQGIQVEDHFYIWDELYDFYFRRIEHTDTLIVRTIALVPGELRIPLKRVAKEHVRHVLVQFLPYREVVRQGFLERSSEWLSRVLPLERES